MSTLSISLTDALQSYVDQQVAERGYETCSEYIRDLIQRDLDRRQLRVMIMEGVESPPAVVADDAFFAQVLERLGETEPR